jgi:uncharacterized membrane protein
VGKTRNQGEKHGLWRKSWPPADFVVTSDPHWSFFGIFTLPSSGFLKALIALVTNLPWDAKSHFPLRLHFQFLFFLLWAALVLKIVGLYTFLASGVALIALVGSENQAQPTRILATVLRFNSV